MIAHAHPNTGRRRLEELNVGPGLSALGEPFVERRDPTPLPDPTLIAFNPDVAALLELSPDEALRPEALNLLAGNARFSSVPSFAARYAGHQFGAFVPQLGDGRAITLGEVLTSAGERWEWQLKGSGLTAFSRFGDGRAVLRSTIREYLASEALFHLGIPTTRALAVVSSPEPVFRERRESAAVLSRIAPSHVRFGSFEIFHARREFENVRALADFTLERFYPELGNAAERYARFLQSVTERTARLVAAWQAVGFAHGVMNTDNMSILGLTLDYGPYGFVEAYDPRFICNHSDDYGRYAFERQPSIAFWNCRALAVALSSLVTPENSAAALAAFEPAYREAYLRSMRAKLGLETARDEDVDLIQDLLDTLEAARADYTRFFRALSRAPLEAAAASSLRTEFLDGSSAWEPWYARYLARLESEPVDPRGRRDTMLRVNPNVVLRNYLAQETIAAAERGDYAPLARLHDALRRPFDDLAEHAHYSAAPPEWAQTLEVSCSS